MNYANLGLNNEVNLIKISELSLKNYLLLLGGTFSIIWLYLAIDPMNRLSWFMENILVFAFVIFMVWSYGKLPLSRISYTLIFIFLFFHQIGAHHTYGYVPYDAWFRSFTGITINEVFGWERNHFDRLVHFLYGALIVCAAKDTCARSTNTSMPVWSYIFAFNFVVATSAIFELMEWMVDYFLSDQLGDAYMAIQGDIWDAQKDMALASLGALITLTLIFSVNQFRGRPICSD